jgi:hypothetical protein
MEFDAQLVVRAHERVVWVTHPYVKQQSRVACRVFPNILFVRLRIFWIMRTAARDGARAFNGGVKSCGLQSVAAKLISDIRLGLSDHTEELNDGPIWHM